MSTSFQIHMHGVYAGSSSPLGAYLAGLLACAVLLAVLPFRQTEQLNAFSRFIGVLLITTSVEISICQCLDSGA